MAFLSLAALTNHQIAGTESLHHDITRFMVASV